MSGRVSFSCDYMRGAHPAVLEALVKTNLEQSPGYGTDPHTERAKELIRAACGCPGAGVWLLVGGTQTNAAVIDAFLRPYEGVLAAETGHVSVHEAGAIEAGGHKVLTLPQENGKISAKDVKAWLERFYRDETHEHMVQPGLLYISQPTEYGTLYSKAELTELRGVCAEYGIPLYADGARLAYALACPKNDVSLRDLAELTDAFYIGGTKCGALFGEAVVVPQPEKLPHFFTLIKQHGALLAKGRLLGLQYEALFEDGLYERIGLPALRAADRIRAALAEKGYELTFGSPTNQVFTVMENRRLAELAQRVEYGFWENRDEEHTVVRFATDWSTSDEEVDELLAAL